MIRQLLGLPEPKSPKLEQQACELDDLAKAQRDAVDEVSTEVRKLVAKANGALHKLRETKGESQP
jgi:hypothetical protein